MKKVLTVLLVLLVLATLGSLIFYRFYMPKMVATTITSDEPPPSILPEKVKKTIIKARVELDKQMTDVPVKLEQLGLTFDDVIDIVEVVDTDQIEAAIEELQSTELKSVDQAFDIGLKHVNVDGYDLSIFREVFKEKATLDKIRKGLLKTRDNDLMTAIRITVARETVRQILIERRDKVEAHLSK